MNDDLSQRESKISNSNSGTLISKKPYGVVTMKKKNNTSLTVNNKTISPVKKIISQHNIVRAPQNNLEFKHQFGSGL